MMDRIQDTDRGLVLDRRWHISAVQPREKGIAADADLGGEKKRQPLNNLFPLWGEIGRGECVK